MTGLATFGPGLAMWTPGIPEVIIILAVALLLFGGKKLPELARGLARGLRTFKDEMMGIKTDIGLNEPTEKPDSQTPETPETPDAPEPKKIEDQQ